MCECFVFLSQRGSRCRTPSLFVLVLGVSQRLFSSYANGVAQDLVLVASLATRDELWLPPMIVEIQLALVNFLFVLRFEMECLNWNIGST